MGGQRGSQARLTDELTEWGKKEAVHQDGKKKTKKLIASAENSWQNLDTPKNSAQPTGRVEMNWMEWIAEHGRLTAALSNIAYESGFHDGDERSGDKPSLHDYRSLLAKAEEALGAHAAKAFAYGMSEAA